jgi:hypothetical protein
LLGCEGIAAFRSIMGLPFGIVLGAAVGFYGGFIAGYADALAEDPLVSEEKLLTTAIISGILGAIQGIIAFCYLGGVGRSGACFTAGTPLLTPDGAKPIEQLKPGDRVLARDESDPAGPVEAKLVEEVFVLESEVLYLMVGGRRIGTTREHPFYVRGRGWTKAGELRPGDVLVGHDGQTSTVQAIEAGKRETVYNMRVQDYHTYFVGCDEWGFSVWVHNAYVVKGGLGHAWYLSPIDVTIMLTLDGTTVWTAPNLSHAELARRCIVHKKYRWCTTEEITAAGGRLWYTPQHAANTTIAQYHYTLTDLSLIQIELLFHLPPENRP